MITRAGRNWITVLVLALFLGLIGISLIFNSGYAQDCPEAEKEVVKSVEVVRAIIMETPKGVESSQPSVVFSHLDHAMDYGCAICHHKWNPEEEASPKQCVECHSNTEERRGEDSYFAAFHDRQAEASCLGCHMITAQEEELPNGPTRCNECHIRD